MRDEEYDESAPRIQAALDELRGMILAAYPTASFTVGRGNEPVVGIYLRPTVDVADIDEVFDVVADRLIDIQVEEGLPVYVFPGEPLARTVARMNEQAATAPAEPITSAAG